MSKSIEIPPFEFKQFTISQEQCVMKSGEDGVLLGTWSHSPVTNNILDIGAGTGVVSLILAQRFGKASIDAVEIDDGSFKDCSGNFKNSPWSERLTANHGLIQEFTKSSDRKYDLIVCNPPFFSGGTMSFSTDKNQVRSTTKLSHSDLLRSAKSLMNKEGSICVILPLIEGLRFTELATTSGLHLVKRTDIRQQSDDSISRLLLRFSMTGVDVVHDQITLFSQDSKRTAEFYNLTSGILA